FPVPIPRTGSGAEPWAADDPLGPRLATLGLASLAACEPRLLVVLARLRRRLAALSLAARRLLPHRARAIAVGGRGGARRTSALHRAIHEQGSRDPTEHAGRRIDLAGGHLDLLRVAAVRLAAPRA